jgi:hypothetical protein
MGLSFSVQAILKRMTREVHTADGKWESAAVRFDVFMAGTMKNAVFWDIKP